MTIPTTPGPPTSASGMPTSGPGSHGPGSPGPSGYDPTVVPTPRPPKTPTFRVRRSRGAVNGALVVLLGLWGGFVALVGPAFDFGYTPDDAWDVTEGRWAMSIAPAAAAVIGGILLIIAANRAAGLVGGGLACLGGAWFVVGPILAPLWDDDGDFLGSPLGTTKSGDNTNEIVAEQLTVFFGTGLLIVFLAAVAAARFTVFGVGDVRAAEEAGVKRQVAKEQRQAERDAVKAHKRSQKDAALAHRRAEKDAARAQRDAEKQTAPQAPANTPMNTPQHPGQPGLNTPSSGAPLPPYQGPTTSEPPTQSMPPQPPGWSPPGGPPRG